ncbi:DUF1559 family PulG-like putative transporter [Allorhodopirellula solitaria]|uniref:DUF1559 domain-containing protein n=1 Tax=Allorhodopirellula solitaria TaxID=2527987 RepID=A0A5C5X0F8_9BACT|nr:DUF1559 domain-containing protein [Allorhodopirellula solitaria]TWT56300.1 hypothetical protein CA85_43030 [Allorhodopirellula solitaria]
MHEDLLGYLLGALEPDEMRRVEQWLREDAEARRELAELEGVLKRLEEADDADAMGETDLQPPPDLVSRTMAILPPLPPMEGNPSPTAAGDPPTAGGVPPFAASAPQSDQASFTNDNFFGDVRLSRTKDGGNGDSWNRRDWVASIAAALILVAIALPAVMEGRFVARRTACQNNLRELGISMTQFADRNAQSRLPPIARDGHLAFAGIYVPWLHGAGLLRSPQQTLCPSIGQREFWDMRRPAVSAQQGMTATPPAEFQIANLQDLDYLDDLARELELARDAGQSDPNTVGKISQILAKLRWLQMMLGGHYSYTLGVRDGGQYLSPRFEGRSQFAVMSDAAVMQLSATDPTSARRATYRFHVTSHSGRGINVLYEDGHVTFLPSESLDRIPDNPLLNHEGTLEAGVTLDDASLGPSWQPPFIHANQR